MVDKFSSNSINTIYTNGGIKYQVLKNFLSSHGIWYLILPPYEPWYLASTEGRHWHIVETDLTFHHWASLPLFIWPYAFVATKKIANRWTRYLKRRLQMPVPASPFGEILQYIWNTISTIWYAYDVMTCAYLFWKTSTQVVILFNSNTHHTCICWSSIWMFI